MLTRFLLLLQSIFVCSAIYCQDSTLQKVLSAKDDTLKVKNLSEYAQQLVDVDNKKAAEVLKTVISLSDKFKLYKRKGLALLDLGYINYTSGNYAEARQLYVHSLQSYKQSKNQTKVAECQINIGTTYDVTGKADSAISYYMAALETLEHINKTSYLLSRVYQNLANLYSGHLDNHEKAILYFKKAEEAGVSSKDTVGIIGALIGMGNEFLIKKANDTAFSITTRALEMAKRFKYHMMTGWAYDHHARALLVKNRIDEAIQASDSAIVYANKATDAQGFLIASVTLSKTLLKKGSVQKAIEVLEKALIKCKEVNDVLRLVEINEQLANAYYAKGEYKKAFNAYKSYTLYKDSVESDKNKNLIANLDIKYQTAQKEKIIAQKNLDVARKEVQLQKSRQMSVYSIGSAIVALMVAFLVFFYFRSKRKLDQKQLQSLRQEKEIHLLQAVMQGEEKERSRIAKDLHDGVAGMLAAVKMHFNSIALHVGGVLQTEGYQQGIRLLDEASHEVRKTSHNLMPEVLLQHGLEEAIRRYCNNVTNSSKLVVQYDSIGELGRFVDGFELSVYRIVQELLNNIVKHSRASEAIVQVTYQAKLLSITIEDNGIGLSKDDRQKDGIGLKSLQTRVKAMNGKIEFDSTAGQGLNAYLEFETAGLEKTDSQFMNPSTLKN
jgi:signal transduction histidine kinase